jgi:LysM repeat protein
MKIKIPKLFSRKKLRATVARRSLRASAETYDDMSEPNMKLSRALLIVLVLHVVAVSGIVAFNAIKTRQDSFAPKAVSTPAPNAGSAIKPNESTEHVVVAQKETAKPAHSSSKPAEHAAKPSDSGKVYVVAKGDNPVTIAKKLKVSYDELLDLNHISDPRKLQIGQKLLIPKAVKGKKTDE